MFHALAALVLLAAAPAADDPQAPTVSRATEQMAAGRPRDVLATIEPALAAYQAVQGGEMQGSVCTYSPDETAASLRLYASGEHPTVAIGPGWCDALFIKGLALSDLRRFAEAAPVLEQAVEMAPFHAPFLSELGFVYQQQRDWQRSYDTYQRARDASDLAPDDRKQLERGRALRGMGYALIEQGEWDRAEALYRECLRMDPDDARAKNELRYIEQQRNRPKA